MMIILIRLVFVAATSGIKVLLDLIDYFWDKEQAALSLDKPVIE